MKAERSLPPCPLGSRGSTGNKQRQQGFGNVVGNQRFAHATTAEDRPMFYVKVVAAIVMTLALGIMLFALLT